jgi:hypothetical protein
VPPMRIRIILWNGNTSYATRRATIEEIEDVLRDHRSDFRRNLPNRAATHLAKGRTAAGRPSSSRSSIERWTDPPHLSTPGRTDDQHRGRY